MKEFKANPLGKGNNKLFPPRIEIHENGVKYIQQGVFNGTEFFVPFSEIKDISISTPFIGFGSIKIYGGKFSKIDAISGFTNDEVREIRDLIELGQKNPQNLIKALKDEDWEDEEDEDEDEDLEDEEDEDEDGDVDEDEEEDSDEEDSDILGSFISAFSSSPKPKSKEPKSKDTSVVASTVASPSAAPPSAKPTPPPPPSFSFYALIDNKQYGPYDKIQFKRLVDNDMVNMDTFVWKEGMAQWQAAKDVPEMEEFFPKKNSQTPPPPPSTMGPPPPPVQ